MGELVSVIIPAYNREKTIEKAVQSVLDQTYKDIEVIVVDDGSTDATVSVVKDIGDKRVKCISLDKNSGACRARNKGIEKARGRYIAFQDSDDIWKSEKLEKQIAILKSKPADLTFCAFERIRDTERTIMPLLDEGLVSRKALLGKSLVSTQTLVGKRECFEKIVFDEEMPRLQDYDITIRLSEKFDFYFIKEPLVEMYVGNDSISRSTIKLLNAEQRIFAKYKSEMEQYPAFKLYNLEGLAKAKLDNKIYCTKDYIYACGLNPSIKSIGRIFRAAIADVRVYFRKRK